ncbi:hypothetical protein [Candidatus Villigracilis saccharophilus]|uniref:hypothetical protein n=1 Tax=Candidatus Villigracilis saccharophilus TaxID=3140684 RepID=UPI0031356F29|nr:hypothetical protein [Anaerolineales bacterium]
MEPTGFMELPASTGRMSLSNSGAVNLGFMRHMDVEDGIARISKLTGHRYT